MSYQKPPWDDIDEEYDTTPPWEKKKEPTNVAIGYKTRPAVGDTNIAIGWRLVLHDSDWINEVTMEVAKLCPHCGQPLSKEDRYYRCQACGDSFIM